MDEINHAFQGEEESNKCPLCHLDPFPSTSMASWSLAASPQPSPVQHMKEPKFTPAPPLPLTAGEGQTPEEFSTQEHSCHKVAEQRDVRLGTEAASQEK